MEPIQEQLKMPPIIIYGHFDRKDQPSANEDPELTRLLQPLRQQLNKHFAKWQKIQGFKFDMPKSTFKRTGNGRPIIKFHKPGEIPDGLELAPLSEQQLASIKKDGTFQVKSPHYTIPYRWKLNEWIYKGSNNIYIQFLKDLAKAYEQLREIPNRFTSDLVSVKKGIRRAIQYVPHLFNLLVGVRKGSYSYDSVYYLLEFHRHEEILKRGWPIEKHFYEYINIPIHLEQKKKVERRTTVQKRINKISKVDSVFHTRWSKIKDDTQENILKTTNNPDEIDAQTKMAQRTLLLQILKQEGFQNDTDPKAIQDFLLNLDRLDQILVCQANTNNKTTQQVKQFETRLEQNHPIRRYAKKWRADQIMEFREEQQKNNRYMMQLQLRQKLQWETFNITQELKQTEETRLKQVQQNIPKVFNPNRVFRCPYKLFPPYRVVQVKDNHSEQGYHYQLIKEDNYYVQTTYFGWKIVLNFIRWYTWTINVIYWLFRGLWGGRLGVKVLFGCQTFYPRYDVDSKTGQLKRSRDIHWNPISVQIANTCQGINESRRAFEQSPDNGFFGKTCSRFCNLIENYIFRLIIVCFFWLMILKPIIIVVNVIVCLLIAITAILWIPIIIIVYYFFNLLIYNFDLDQRYPVGRYSERLFPLVLQLVKFIYDVTYTIFSILMGILIHPLFAFFIFLWSMVRWFGRTLYDKFMFCAVSCCGRSPVRDTGIAWKISGPGLSRQYFQSVKESDVYILMMAMLQNLQLANHEANITKRLNSLRDQAQKVMGQVTKYLKNQAYTDFNDINTSIAFYQEILRKQLYEIRQTFPSYSNLEVRFTGAELEKYLPATRQMIRTFIERQNQMHLFAKFEIRKGDYDRLNQRLWTEIFRNEDVFEPFENLDARFQLIDDRQDEFINGVMHAIKGQINLKEGSQVPILKTQKKRQSTIVLATPTHLTQIYSLFQEEQLPFNSSRIDWYGFVNYNFPQIYENQKKKVEMTASSVQPMSGIEQF